MGSFGVGEPSLFCRIGGIYMSEIVQIYPTQQNG